MKYQLETFPVLEALEQKEKCPFCVLKQNCEQKELERCLGGSVMEPDCRIVINEKGFCYNHHKGLYALQNRLGHALLVHSNSITIIDKLKKIKNTKKSKAQVMALQELFSSCVICEAVENNLERYFYTFVYLYQKEEDFKIKWQNNQEMCLPHATALIKSAWQHAHKKVAQELSDEVLDRLLANLIQTEKDLEWFTLKFDYRNADLPFGNSRQALPKMINILRENQTGEESL